MELTKGTWKKRRSATGSWVIDTDDELIAKEIRECNADAIAAVPEMVAALEMYECYTAEPHHEFVKKYGEVEDAWWNILLKAQAALAKARGEQQDET